MAPVSHASHRGHGFGARRRIVAALAARVFRAASLLFALQGCEDPSAPELPDGAVPLEPLAPYRTWWNLVQACSNLTGSYAAIRWYSAPQVSAADSTVRALWTEAGNRIVVRAI